MNTTSAPRWATWLPLVLLLSLYVLVIVQRAWMGDDPFITLRTVDHFVAGRGLVYNAGERVQSYTHPLWLFLLSLGYFFTREPYYTTLFLSVLVSFAALLVLAFGMGMSRMGVVFAVLVLTLSNAYVDYSTSGLENPLTHLLLIIFLAVFLRRPSSGRKLFWLAFVAALGVVNRMDTGLLFLPALVYEFFRTPAPWRRRILLSAAGMAPFLLWELFSLVYYGFLVPNTAVAKLNIDVPTVELWKQGLVYLLNALRFDAITLLVIVAGLVVAVLSRERRALLVALGTLLYLIYLVNIGGDFMAGRFLTAPLLAMVVVMATYLLESLPAESLAVALGAVVVVGLLSPWPTLRATERTETVIDNGMIANERLVYFDNNLAFASRLQLMPAVETRFEGVVRRFDNQTVEIWRSLGMHGYYAGPAIHVIDSFALTDPLLARLPPVHRVIWRIGHFERLVPEGYRETLETGENHIADPQLAEYYDRLSLVTRGPIWSLARWREIWRFNTGYYDGWIDEQAYRFPLLVTVDQADVSAFLPTRTPIDAPGVTQFSLDGIDVALAVPSHATQARISLDGNTRYLLWFLNGDTVVGRVWLEETGGRFADQLVLFPADVPAAAARAGYDRVRAIPRLTPDELEARHALGHLHLLDPRGWPGCGAGSCDILLGDPRARELLRDGWATPEAWGAWSQGPASAVELALAGGQAYRLTVRAFPYETLCDQTLAVQLNGRAVGEAAFGGCGERELSFDLPAATVIDGANELRFEYGATATPGAAVGDLRQLGVGFIELQLQPAAGN